MKRHLEERFLDVPDAGLPSVHIPLEVLDQTFVR
jgi:hypothetical protein